MLIILQLAELFCNSVGILQQSAPPGSFAGLEKAGSKEPAVNNDGEYLVLH